MEESKNIRLHSTKIPEHLQKTEYSIDPETGELRSSTLVAIVSEEDIRCEQIINKLNSGELTLSEAVTEARAELDKEYSEPLHDLLWSLGMEEHRILERQDREKFLASLTEEERRR